MILAGCAGDRALSTEPRPGVSSPDAVIGTPAQTMIVAKDGSCGPDCTVLANGSILSGFSNRAPLYVVDGVPLMDPAPRWFEGLDFETVEIMRGSEAAAKYGNRGANGVIVLTTTRAAAKGGG